MQDGLCYIQYNSNTIYAFPNLTCNEGSYLPSYTNTVRETYYIYEGRYVLSNRQNITSTSGGNYTNYISHVANNQEYYAIDINSVILPATLFVLAFMSVVYRWFIRLRG